MNHQSRRPQARILPSARSKSEEESDDLMNCGTDHHHHPQDDRPGPSTSKNLRLSSSNGSSSTFHQLLSEPDHSELKRGISNVFLVAARLPQRLKSRFLGRHKALCRQILNVVTNHKCCFKS